jgi:hypothetical protein
MPNGLYVLVQSGERKLQLRVGKNLTAPPWLYAPRPRPMRWRRRIPFQVAYSIWLRFRWELPLIRTAALFSLFSIVNLGVAGIDLGRWLRLIQGREFELKARGTMRVVAGLQSVSCFMLLALAAVSYFGHPFESGQ